MTYRSFPLAVVLGAALAASPALALAQSTQGSSQGTQGSTQTTPRPGQQGGQQQGTPPSGTAQNGAGQAAAAPGGGRDCMDQAYDFSMSGPGEWVRATDTSSISVPGEVRCVWSPDGTTVLVAFVQKVKKPTNPRTLLTASVNAIQKGLGATVPEQSVRDVGGMRAMWMVVNGKGTGAALTANGDVPTAQHWVAIPRAQDVVIFLLTAPQAKFGDQDQIFQTALGTLKVGGTQTPEQRAAK
jgi:hypothetical protein